MSKTYSLLAVAAAVLLSVAVGLARSGPSGEARAAAAEPFGLGPRVPWTSSRVVGSPEPPDPFVTARAFPNLKFDRPLHVTIGPGGKRWFVVEQGGLIHSVPTTDADARKPDLFLDARPVDPTDPKWADRRQLWSVTFHPRFAENGQVFVCFLEGTAQGNMDRIVRYTVAPEARSAGVPTCRPQTEQLVIEWPAYEDHFGGCLQFGPDGYLYVSAGDGSGYADGGERGQDISDLNASILRIDVDHPSGGKPYSVPADNPFVATPGARGEVWAYGLRNVWKFSIDHPSGQLWAGDVGQDLWEPVVLVERGGNYGWSVTEGTHDFRPARKRGPTPILKPAWEHEHSEARSLTGGFVYRGARFPQLAGKYVYGDYETGKIWSLSWDASAKRVTEHRQLVDTPFKLVAFGQDAAGELILLDYQGTLHRLEPNPAFGDSRAASAFPRKLSETGLFASTRDLTPAAGVVPYDVNSPLWSDGAHKQRYLAVPADKTIGYTPENAWAFPDGSVLVKTFSLDLETGNPATRRRLETRILHVEQQHWRGYTYLWNEAQTDADLLDDPRGRDQAFEVKDAAAAGGVRRQTWHYPSRAECTLCHTMPAGFVLGVETRQMNREYAYAGGVRDNQIRALEHAGYFEKPAPREPGAPNPAAPAAELPGFRGTTDRAAYDALPRMPSPTDPHASLDDRARAYLHANCSHCHRKWGGGNALFELTYGKPLAETRTVDVRPQHGEHVADGRLLRPGDPGRSLLLYRMRQTDEKRMPRVGSSVVDEAGARLVEAWIRGQ